MGYKQSQERNKRLRKIHSVTRNWYSIGTWYNPKTKHIVREYPYKRNGRNYKKYLCKLSNKKIRKLKLDKYNNNSYKRVYNIWNELF